MSDIEAVLRNAAVEIRAADLPGWGNACEWGADRIRELDAELAASEKYRANLAHAHVAKDERIRELEAALREVQRQYQTHCEVFLGEEIQERIDAILTPMETVAKCPHERTVDGFCHICGTYGNGETAAGG